MLKPNWRNFEKTPQYLKNLKLKQLFASNTLVTKESYTQKNLLKKWGMFYQFQGQYSPENSSNNLTMSNICKTRLNFTLWHTRLLLSLHLRFRCWLLRFKLTTLKHSYKQGLKRRLTVRPLIKNLQKQNWITHINS